MKQPKIFEGRVFKMYFSSLYEQIERDEVTGERSRSTSCMVVAKSAEEAIQKAKLAFPGETVDSVYMEREYSHHPHIEKVVI